MARPRWVLWLLILTLGAAGSVAVLASGASAQATQSACSLLSAQAIEKVIRESVQDGAPSEYAPTSCEYPLKPTTDLKRAFFVSLDPTAQCSTTMFKGRTAIKVGRSPGIYDVTTRQSTPKTEIHSPSLSVTVGTGCVSVSWDLAPGPLPTGGRATAVRKQLTRLEALAISHLGR